MNLQFLGATDTVTGSKYLVGHDGRRVLIDCGLFQGYKQLRLRNWSPLPIPATRIDAVVLTHAHIDHSGYLPLLARSGFSGPVYCSTATRDLCRVLLPDSGYLLEEEAEFANRHQTSKHSPALPLYTRQDAERSLRLLRTVPFERPWDVVPGLRGQLTRSGHMAGSSFVRLDDGHTSILFSGDLGRPEDLLLKPPQPVQPADYLVVESTYGDRLHARRDVLRELATIINRTAARGGAVIIPAFAVGRAQALLHAIRVLKDRGDIARSLPIFLNSPMAARATEIYLDHGDELRLSADDRRALADTAQIVVSAEDSKRLNGRGGPMVIIAASGMATGGRVVHHLKSFAPDARNTLLFAGFQAGGTRGASIVGGARSVRVFGQDIPIRAEIASLGDLSAHADADELMRWMRAMGRAPRATFITHGEPAAADALRQRIERELGWRCHMPHYLESVEL